MKHIFSVLYINYALTDGGNRTIEREKCLQWQKEKAIFIHFIGLSVSSFLLFSLILQEPGTSPQILRLQWRNFSVYSKK